MLKGEAIATKEQLQNSRFDDFSASDGCLDCWKTTYSVKELGIVGEAGNMSLETVTSWMERKKNGIQTNLAVLLKLYWTKGQQRKENKQRVAKN